MTTTEFNFEKSLKELESITQWFESGDANLDQGLEKFERGMELASQLKRHLADIDNRVEKIKHKFAAPAETSAPGALTDTATDPAPAPPDNDDSQTGLF